MSKPLILVVEDEIEQQEILIEILKDSFSIITAASGKEAIQQFNLHNLNIDLILLDINLSDMTAYEVYSAWKKISFSSIPNIIMVTAYNKTSDMIKSLTENAAFFHLGKPFSKSKLLSIIDEALCTPYFDQKTYQLNISIFINHWLSKRNEKIINEQMSLNQFKSEYPLDQQFLFEGASLEFSSNFHPQKVLNLLENDTGFIVNQQREYKICHYGNKSNALNFLYEEELEHVSFFHLDSSQSHLLNQADIIFIDAEITDEILKLLKTFRTDLFPWDENFEPKHFPDIFLVYSNKISREDIRLLIKAGLSNVFFPTQDIKQKKEFIKHQILLKTCLEYLPTFVKKLLSQNHSFRIRWENWIQLPQSEKTFETLDWLFKEFNSSIKLLQSEDLFAPTLKEKIKKSF